MAKTGQPRAWCYQICCAASQRLGRRGFFGLRFLLHGGAARPPL